MADKLLDIHPTALEEFKSALAWYLERNETAAANFVTELDRAVELIMQAPKRWPAGEHATRRYVLQRFPFALIYREKDKVVEILAIAHGHRRPSYWKGRV